MLSPRSLSWIVALSLTGVASAQIGPEPDATIERCLLTAKIVKKTANLKGVTRPVRFAVECDGKRREAVFKSLDEFHRGVTTFEEGGWEVNFSDSYKYERTAYLLDRELGLNMVPVAVLREVRRNDGALIDWVTDASHERKAKNRPTPQQMAALARQKATMRLFDALIYNVDRNPTNWLVDDEDWNLYLIDHSRSFRTLSELPKKYIGQRAWLSRGLQNKLEALNEDRLIELFEGLVSRGQIEALLARRDRLLEKIQSDIDQHGESVVLFE